MIDPLLQEGLTDFQTIAVTYPGEDWSVHAAGMEQCSFPIMPDTMGVYDLLGAKLFTMMLVDKKGRMVSTFDDFGDNVEAIEKLKKRIRELYVEE